MEKPVQNDKQPNIHELLARQQARQQTPQPAIQTPTKQPVDNGVSNDVKKAKDAAEIAQATQKRVEAEIQTKLKLEGYETIEKAKESIKQKLEEANQIFEAAQQEREQLNQALAQFGEDKEKLRRFKELIEQREGQTNSRLEQAIKLENERNNHNEQDEIRVERLKNLVDYHTTHIVPCTKALKHSLKAFYAMWGLIENPKGLAPNTLSSWLTSGLNYVGQQTNALDKYIERMTKKE